MTPKDILIPFAIFALQMFVIKWIDVKIKFAKSEAEAIAAIKTLGTRLLSLVGLATPGVFAFLEFIKEGPVTKSAVIYMFLFTIGLSFRFSLYWEGDIISILKGSSKLTADLSNATEVLRNATEAQNEILSSHNKILKELAEELNEA
jgi:hypothetical protein